MSLSSYRKYRTLGSHAYYARRRRWALVGASILALAAACAIYSTLSS